MLDRSFNFSTWVTHAFNPNTREVETGMEMAGHIKILTLYLTHGFYY